MRCFTCKRVILLSILLISLIAYITFTVLTQDNPYPTGKPPNITRYNYVINNEVCLPSEDILAVLVVVSHAGNQLARTSLRAAYPATELRRLRLRRVFLLGKLQHDRESDFNYDSIPQSKISEEAKEFSDIVQVDLTESYYSLTFKSLLALQWGARHCNHSRIVIKIDDDALVDLYQMVDLLNSFSEADADCLIGRKERDGVGFLLGLVYMTSPRTAARLVKASRSLAMHTHEDIYVTGYLAKYAGVERLGIGGVITPTADLRCCKEAEEAVFECGYIVGQRKGHGVGGDYALQGKVQEHASYCYYSGLCRTFSLVRDLVARYGNEDYLKCVTELKIKNT